MVVVVVEVVESGGGGDGGVLDRKLGRQVMLLGLGLMKMATNTAATLKMMKRKQLDLSNRGIRQLKCPSLWVCHWVQSGEGAV
jgi:hypothetical protein